MKITSLSSLKDTTVSHNPKITKRVMIANGEIANITNFSRAVFPPGEIAGSHSHGDMTEVFFIESGQGTITINNMQFTLSPGMCITVKPHEAHELNNTGSTELTVLYFGINT